MYWAIGAILYPASAATVVGFPCFSITFSRSGSKMTLSWTFPGVTMAPRTKPFRSEAADEIDFFEFVYSLKGSLPLALKVRINVSYKIRISAGQPVDEASRMDKKHPFFLDYMMQE